MTHRADRNTNPGRRESRNAPHKPPTIKLCRYAHVSDPECVGSYRWQFESDNKVFVVCDTHLAMGLRCAGFPALISENPKHTADDAEWNIFENPDTPPKNPRPQYNALKNRPGVYSNTPNVSEQLGAENDRVPES